MLNTPLTILGQALLDTMLTLVAFLPNVVLAVLIFALGFLFGFAKEGVTILASSHGVIPGGTVKNRLSGAAVGSGYPSAAAASTASATYNRNRTRSRTRRDAREARDAVNLSALVPAPVRRTLAGWAMRASEMLWADTHGWGALLPPSKTLSGVTVSPESSLTLTAVYAAINGIALSGANLGLKP